MAFGDFGSDDSMLISTDNTHGFGAGGTFWNIADQKWNDIDILKPFSRISSIPETFGDESLPEVKQSVMTNIGGKGIDGITTDGMWK